MKLFILENCPHCKRALNWMKELQEENEAYKRIEIEIIDEAKHPEIADTYDYYYVPAYFIGSTKVHEGVVFKEKIKKIFDDALK